MEGINFGSQAMTGISAGVQHVLAPKSTAGTAHTAEWEGGRAGMAHTAAREVGSASGTGMDVLADMAAREGGRAGTSEG